jgi:hypothetical protein
MRKQVVRVYGSHGWAHMEEVKRGRKWIVVRELFKRSTAEGKMVYRKKRVKLADTAESLW